jgi:hypothetical protein
LVSAGCLCHGLCSMPHSQVQAAWRLRHHMRTKGIRSLACCAKLATQTGQLAVCKLFWLLPHAQGLCIMHNGCGAAMLSRPK